MPDDARPGAGVDSVRRTTVASDAAPLMSAIVIARDDEDRIERSLRSVVDQRTPAPFEVIVVTSGTDRTAAIVREKFADVRLVALPDPALPGEARNAGLRLARGRYISFPGSHVELPQGSLAARMRAHEAGHHLVTGSARNGTLTPAGWAVYFIDNSSVLPRRPAGELTGPPLRCSYSRDALRAVGEFPEGWRTGEDSFVNEKLWDAGYSGWFTPEVSFVHRSPCRTVGRLVRHRFARGRGGARMLRIHHHGRLVPLVRWAVKTQFGALRRPRRVSADVARWGGDLKAVYRRVYPLVVLGTLATWAGTWYELLVGSAPIEAAPRATMPLILARVDLAGERERNLVVARLDLAARRILVTSLPSAGITEAAPKRLRGAFRERHKVYPELCAVIDGDALQRLLDRWTPDRDTNGSKRELGLLMALRAELRTGRLPRAVWAVHRATESDLGPLQLPALAWMALRLGSYRVETL